MTQESEDPNLNLKFEQELDWLIRQAKFIGAEVYDTKAVQVTDGYCGIPIGVMPCKNKGNRLIVLSLPNKE